jgi:hypothetical protein
MSGLSWQNFAEGVTAVGAFGTAAFGIVESAGKAFCFSWLTRSGRFHTLGLPYAGFGLVKRMVRPLAPALRIAYGNDYLEIIGQQYYAGRASGSAPDTIRQGVRLGLPFMGADDAANLIKGVWHMPDAQSKALAQALQASGAPSPTPQQTGGGPIDPTLALAGRFATALDARINAAFVMADQRYQTSAKTAAGFAAVALALGFNLGLGSPFPMLEALGLGLLAVPLAPVAKDLSTSLQNALTAFKSIPIVKV